MAAVSHNRAEWLPLGRAGCGAAVECRVQGAGAAGRASSLYSGVTAVVRPCTNGTAEHTFRHWSNARSPAVKTWRRAFSGPTVRARPQPRRSLLGPAAEELEVPAGRARRLSNRTPVRGRLLRRRAHGPRQRCDGVGGNGAVAAAVVAAQCTDVRVCGEAKCFLPTHTYPSLSPPPHLFLRALDGMRAWQGYGTSRSTGRTS